MNKESILSKGMQLNRSSNRHGYNVLWGMWSNGGFIALQSLPRTSWKAIKDRMGNNYPPFAARPDLNAYTRQRTCPFPFSVHSQQTRPCTAM